MDRAQFDDGSSPFSFVDSGKSLFNLLHYLLLIAVVPLSSPAEDVDFTKDVLPIFRQHCFECHGGGNTEGELSLDSISGILQGGHTSSPLLTPALPDSELYLRITSLADGYRMPKEGKPLSQQEVETIGKWIRRVAYRDDDPLTKPEKVNDLSASSPSSVEPDVYVDASSKPLVSIPSTAADSSTPKARSGFDIGAMIEEMQLEQVATFILGTAFLIVLLAWIAYKMTLGRPSRRRISRGSDRVLALLSMVIGASSMLMILGMAYLHWRNGNLYRENVALRAQIQENNAYKSTPLIKIDEANLPLPPHPMHPPRLGGQYYRGNDERSDALFNRGFYRTATFDLQLVGPNGKRLQWNDPASDDLAIEIQVQRAPKATRELFTERVRNRAVIEHYCETDKSANEKLKFSAIEIEQRWLARIPLPPRDAWSEDKVQGMVYLMFGNQPGESQMPRPHFAVRYDLKLQDGKISKDSVLWMGSMYTLGNRVLVPDEKKILLDRWFDWRPIPVIEGEASSDPSLLGVDEYQGD